MSLDSYLIEKARADELIAAIEDPTERLVVKLLLEATVEFYNTDPSRLQSSFDLAFFVEVLAARIDEVGQLLSRIVPPGHWGEPYPRPPEPVDVSRDSGRVGIRMGQAFNYAVTHHDRWTQGALLTLTSEADFKQVMLIPTLRVTQHHPSGRKPTVAGAPAQPFDFLFMVMAVDHALRPGQPARRLLEDRTSASDSRRR